MSIINSLKNCFHGLLPDRVDHPQCRYKKLDSCSEDNKTVIEDWKRATPVPSNFRNLQLEEEEIKDLIQKVVDCLPKKAIDHKTYEAVLNHFGQFAARNTYTQNILTGEIDNTNSIPEYFRGKLTADIITRDWQSQPDNPVIERDALI